MVVTFCGHSKLAPSEAEYIQKRLDEVIHDLIVKGADEFLLGGYGDFDRLCALAVKKAKKEHPHIKSVLVIPYIDRDFDKALFDSSEYPPLENVPKKFAISGRNEYMVDCSDFVISFIKHNFGGAFKTLSYAKRKIKQIINI